MGYAIAERLAYCGAEVVLISGPTSLSVINANIRRVNVVSAEEMYNASVLEYASCDGAIMTAAVADFTPLVVDEKKVKRGKENYFVELKPTKDIAASLGSMKTSAQFIVGFALETNDEEFNAKKKLDKKNLDFIVLNSLNDKGAGFQHDTNKISIIRKNLSVLDFPLKTKTDVAIDIVDEIINCTLKK